MNVDVPCPNCGTIFTVRQELLGKRTKCPKCSTVFTLVAPARAIPAKPDSSELPASILPGVHRRLEPEPVQHPTADVQAVSPPGPSRYSAKEVSGFAPDASRPRFSALRIVARLYEVLAVIILVVAAIALLLMIVAISQDPEAIRFLLFSYGVVAFWATAGAMTLLFFAQTIRIVLQVEHNTRETHIACRQLADHLCAVESEH
jgi:predicted Zn finger-like uncharacterized protein